MKVILQKDINGLGDAGEVKEVKDGYARNYLLPRKLVLPAHAGSARAIQHQQRLLSLKTERRKKAMEELAGKLGSIKGGNYEAFSIFTKKRRVAFQK